MKRLMVLFVAILLATICFAPSTQAGTRQLNFTWEQPGATDADFGGWRLYSAESAGGPWTKVGDDIAFTGVSQSYTASKSFESPSGQAKTWYFSITAYDIYENESDRSNVVPVTIDLQSPGVPINLTVTIQPVP